MKLPVFFGRLRTKEQNATVNKSKITGENTFNGYDIDIESTHE